MIQQTSQAGFVYDVALVPQMRQSLRGYYDSLVRRLRGLRNGSGHLPYAIGLTSCNPGEGVSTVSANLAISAAESSGQPVLLIDAELARPSVAKAFGVNASPGLMEAIAGDCLPLDCVQHTASPNLSVITAGLITGRPAPRVDHERLAKLIADWKRDFSLIVFDLPKANALSPCFAMVGALDGVLLVVEADRVDGELAQRAKRQLQESQANVVGVVLNKER